MSEKRFRKIPLTAQKGYVRIGSALIRGEWMEIYEHPTSPNEIMTFLDKKNEREIKFLMVDARKIPKEVEIKLDHRGREIQ